MKIVNFSVYEHTYEEFKKSVASDGTTVPHILRAAMRGYIEGELVLYGPMLIGAHTTSDVPRETPKIGRPKKIKETAKEEPVVLEKSPYLAKKNELPHELRALASYNYPMRPVERDETPGVTFDMKGKDGKTFEEFLKSEWLAFRIEADTSGCGGDVDDWFNASLDMLMNAAANKFAEVNGIKVRYRKDDIWDEVMVFDGQMHVEHQKELEQQIHAFRKVKT